MKLILAVIFTLTPSLAVATDLVACPEGQSHEIVKTLIHDAVIEYEELVRIVPVFEGYEVVTLPAEFEWIEKSDDYVHPETFTYQSLRPVRATYKKVEVPTGQSFVNHNILLRLDGTYSIIDNGTAVPKSAPNFKFMIDTPQHYVSEEKTILMPPAIENNGRLKILKTGPKVIPRDIPQVTKEETYRRIKSRTPAIFQEALGKCR